MSIKVMNAVFDRYPVGGNERLLALALADHAHDDGTHVYPSLERLAEKTMTSESTVRRLLRVMVQRGWLEPIRRGGKGPGHTNAYCISPAWIAGDELEIKGVNLTPLDPVDKLSTRVSKTGLRVSKADVKGVTAMTPEPLNHQRTKKPPHPPLPRGAVDKSPKPEHPDDQTSVDQEDQGDRPPWRWTGKRKDVEAQAVKHGMAKWDETAFNQGKGEQFAVYRSRVQAKVQGP